LALGFGEDLMRVASAILGGMMATACLIGLARAGEINAAEIQRGSLGASSCYDQDFVRFLDCTQNVLKAKQAEKTANSAYMLGFELTAYQIFETMQKKDDAELGMTDLYRPVEDTLYMQIQQLEGGIGVAHADACRLAITDLDICLHMKPPSH
jgi:uncharacterized protein YjhX (UPF0386 family)